MEYEIDPARRAKLDAKSARAKARRVKRAKVKAAGYKKGDIAYKCPHKTLAGRPCPMYRSVLEHPDTGKLYRAPSCFGHLASHHPKIVEMFQLRTINDVNKNKGKQRKPNPKPPEVLKAMVEQDVVTWLAPYLESLTAMKQVVVGNGRHARVVEVPDYRTRQQAADSVFDRVYGKARQTTELTGADGGPVSVEVPTGKDREKEVAQILLAAGAVDQPSAQRKLKKIAAAASGASRN